VHLVADAGLDNMQVEQVHVPPVAEGAFIPAPAQSKPFTLGATGMLLAGSDSVERPASDGVEKSKAGSEELGMAFAAFWVLSK